MPHYPYLIVGGGIAADAAARGIREVDSEGGIGIVAAEPDAPYDRPPLTKELWKSDAPLELSRGTEELGVDLHLGRRAVALDPARRELHDERGARYTFDSLLLATGGTPRQLAGGHPDIIYFRTLRDYQRLRAAAAERQRFAVIGGGFIGSEIAAALHSVGRSVVMIFEELAIGAGTLPADLAASVTEGYRARGIEVLAGEMVTEVTAYGRGLRVRTRGGRSVEVEGVVAGLGIVPETSLARAAGLPVAGGIWVDQMLRAGHPRIYAAGDVARFYHPILRRRLRVEHEDNANNSGLVAGRAMAGYPAPYEHLAYFYSELFDDAYEAVGIIDSQRMTTLADWRDPLREGVVYYLLDGRVRGVLLWNVRAKLRAARKLLGEQSLASGAELVGRI